jgi:type 1 glutamine amidotransferase
VQRVLLFTKTTGFRHESIPAGIAAIQDLVAGLDLLADHTEDAAAFAAANLERYAAVVWLDVSGDVLDSSQRADFTAYLRGGGGFAAIHSSTDAEWSWPEYEQIVGARFLSHPGGTLQFQEAELSVVDVSHPSTASLPDPWRWTDEWYAFTSNPSDRVSVLLTVDESSYDTEGVPMGAPHPISWHSSFGAGRVWYTALGHRDEMFADQAFRAHLSGGVASVLRAEA